MNKLISIILFLFIATYGRSQTINKSNEFLISINGNPTNIYETLSQYIQFKSLSCREQEAGEWLRNICEENNLHIFQMGDEDCNFNFAASIYPLDSDLPNIIFLNHIDVVPPGDTASWTFPPFSGQISGGDIWGRGAYDNKGNAIMQLFSIVQFMAENRSQKLNYNLTFLSVSSEEILGDGGVPYVVNNFLDILKPAVVIGEGAPEISELLNYDSHQYLWGISYAQKAPLWLELELNIPTNGHGSVTPNSYADKEMVAALHRLSRKKQRIVFTPTNRKLLSEIAYLRKGFERFVLKHPDIFKPLISCQLKKDEFLRSFFTNSVTITGVDGKNESFNVILSTTKARLDCRLLPGVSEEKFLTKIKRRLKNSDIKIHTHTKLSGMAISDATSKFYQHFKEAVEANYADSKVVPIFLPNYNDVGSFRAKGVEGFCINPMLMPSNYLNGIHNINERIPVNSMNKCKDTYMKFIKNCMN